MKTLIQVMPGYRTLKAYQLQGWNASQYGYKVDDCPYYATSDAEKHWKRGFRKG